VGVHLIQVCTSLVSLAKYQRRYPRLRISTLYCWTDVITTYMTYVAGCELIHLHPVALRARTSSEAKVRFGSGQLLPLVHVGTGRRYIHIFIHHNWSQINMKIKTEKQTGY